MSSSMLLSTGEFARMCNVSRELLVHYDRIGLLKPKEVTDKGYRYYSLKQLYLFDVIRFFVDAGMSSCEIKEYLGNRSTDLFLDTIDASLDKLRAQRDLLDARIGMMEKMRYLVHRMGGFPKGVPRLSQWDDVWLLSTPASGDRTQEDYARAVSEHSDFCRNTAVTSKFPLGRIVDIPDPHDARDFSYTKIVTWVSKPERAVCARLLGARTACGCERAPLCAAPRACGRAAARISRRGPSSVLGWAGLCLPLRAQRLSTLHEFVHHRRLRERGDVAQVLCLLGRHLPQDAAHHFATARLGQRAGELNHVRLRDGPDHAAHVRHEARLQLVADDGALLYHHEGVDALALHGVRVSHHRHFGNLVACAHGALDLGGAGGAQRGDGPAGLPQQASLLGLLAGDGIL